MFKKILVIYNEKLTKKHLSTVERVHKIIQDRKLSFSAVKLTDLKESDINGSDLIITIGGDGTFTRAANFLKNEFIIGINSEPETSEGALTSIKENELDLLEQVLDGKYCVKQRQRIKVKLNNKILPLAVNDVYIGASSQFHASRYLIKFKGKEEEHRSSGVIVSTGSGSRAWYRSAGGIPFSFSEKVLKFIVREPYFGDRVFKPKILHGEIKENEKIEFESTRDYGGIVTIDNRAYDFNKKDMVEIELSDLPLNVIVK